MRTRTWGPTALTLALAAGTAHGSGFGRPNQIGAKNMGMGGTFTSVADDPTTIYHNPAGLAQITGTNVLLDLAILYAPRTYDPMIGDPLDKPAECATAPDSNALCAKQEGKVPIPAIPALGFSTRLKGGDQLPSRFAFGAGIFLPYGGSVEFERPNLPSGMPDLRISAVDKSQLIDLELVPAVAYEVNEHLLIGGGIRLGFTSFAVRAVNKPVTADLSSSGIGIGFNLGALVRVNKRLNVGMTYMSPMSLQVTGDGVIDLPAGLTDVEFTANIHWPQKVMAGVSAKPADKLTASVQVDWTDWSSFQEILLDLGTINDFAFAQDFVDAYAVHVGLEYALSEKLALRCGYTFDSPAVPDRTTERQYLDSAKHLAAVGAGYKMGRWNFDSAFEMLIPLHAREVPDNSAEVGATRTDIKNVSPGKHQGRLYTLVLTGAVKF